MIKLPMDVYMKTLESYIKDEDKLVTYKWLSKELEVHVNIAKQILEEYWEKHKDNGIVATILIIGHIKDDGMRVEVVKESDLTAAAKKYDKIISQHLYSLQKTLPDIQLLAGSGKGDAKYGAINCEKCVLLSDEELFARRWGSAVKYQVASDESKPVEKKVDTKKSNGIGDFFKESVVNEKVQDDVAKEKAEEKSVPKKISPPKPKGHEKKGAIPKKPLQSQKTGFSNLFGKVSAANQKKSPPINQKNKESPIEVDDKIIKEKPSTNGRNGLFFKSTSKSPEEKESATNNINRFLKKTTSNQEIETPEEKSSTAAAAAKAKTNVERSSPPVEPKASKSTKTEAKSNQNKKPRGTKRGRSQDAKDDSKKRKRIVVVSDSSEESAVSDDEPSIIEASPPREEAAAAARKEKSPSPPPVQNINGKRKVRKLVDKTYVDDDGFLVTKKVHVYESCSEEDEPVKVVESKKAAEPTKVKKQNKQTSLMNFFKKA